MDFDAINNRRNYFSDIIFKNLKNIYILCPICNLGPYDIWTTSIFILLPKFIVMIFKFSIIKICLVSLSFMQIIFLTRNIKNDVICLFGYSHLNLFLYMPSIFEISFCKKNMQRIRIY